MKRSAVIVLVALGACATPQQQVGAPQQQMPFNAFPRPHASGTSSFSAGDDYTFASKGKGLSVPRRGRNTDAVDLVVRPDAITAEIAIREVRPSSPAALDAARRTSAEVFEQLGKALGRPATFKTRGVAAEKVVREGNFVGVVVTVDGLVEVDLPSDLDFWQRSQLFITMLEATATISKDSRSKDEPLRAVSFEDITPAVKNPEDYRAKLTERWVAQARAFAALAQAKESPLSLVDCAPPRAISQVRSSLEEVTLQLAVSCRIDVAGRRSTRPTAPGRPSAVDELE